MNNVLCLGEKHPAQFNNSFDFESSNFIANTKADPN
jgi:hypothetical protein